MSHAVGTQATWVTQAHEHVRANVRAWLGTRGTDESTTARAACLRGRRHVQVGRTHLLLKLIQLHDVRLHALQTLRVRRRDLLHVRLHSPARGVDVPLCSSSRGATLRNTRRHKGARLVLRRCVPLQQRVQRRERQLLQL